MIRDLLNLSGFMVPDRRDILVEGSARRSLLPRVFTYERHLLSSRRNTKLPASLIFDRRLLPQGLSTDEKLKHQYFAQRYHDEVIAAVVASVRVHRHLSLLASTKEHSRRLHTG